MSWTQFCLKLFQRNGSFFPFHSFFYISNSIRFRFFFFLSFFGPLFSWHKSSKPNIGNSCLVFNFTRLFVTCKKLFSGSPIGSYGSKTELLQYYSIKQNAAMIVRRFAFFLKVTIWGHTCVLKIQKLGLLYLIACTTHWLHFSSTCTKVSLLFSTKILSFEGHVQKINFMGECKRQRYMYDERNSTPILVKEVTARYSVSLVITFYFYKFSEPLLSVCPSIPFSNLWCPLPRKPESYEGSEALLGTRVIGK